VLPRGARPALGAARRAAAAIQSSADPFERRPPRVGPGGTEP